jgi:WD40 repeat protein
MFDASFSPDGLRILTIDGMNARIWGAEMGNRLLQLRMPPGGTPIGVFSPDNRRVVTAGTGDSLTIWDGNSGKALRTLQSGNAILTAAFSPNGQYLLTAGLDAPAIYRIVLDKDDVNRISF